MANETLVTSYNKKAKSHGSATFKSVPNITLDKTTVKVRKGEETQLTYIAPSGINTNVNISSENLAIASVSRDDNTINIMGNGNGNTNINLIVYPNTSYYGVNIKIPVTVQSGVRYGYRVKKGVTDPYESVEYIYDAVGMTPAKMDFSKNMFDYGSWKNVWFVEDNKPCMLKRDGVVDYYLDSNNYTYIENTTTASDVASTAYDGNAMAQMPLVYFYRYEDDNYYYEIASDIKYDSNYQAYAHTGVSGNIQPYFYHAIYESSGNATRMRSLSGKTVSQSLTATKEIDGAKANGDNWYSSTWMQHEYIRTLLVLMGKSLNTQAVFGNGNARSATSDNKGLLKTGTLDDKGQFYGSNANYKAAVKVFHVENFWGNQWIRTAGLMNNKGIIYVKLVPTSALASQNYGYQISEVSGYDNTGITATRITSGQYISNVVCSKYGMIPNSTVNGSATTYFCDLGNANNSQLNYLITGGSSESASTKIGAFTFSVQCMHTHNPWHHTIYLSKF